MKWLICGLAVALAGCAPAEFDTSAAMGKCEAQRASLMSTFPNMTQNDYCEDRVAAQAQTHDQDQADLRDRRANAAAIMLQSGAFQQHAYQAPMPYMMPTQPVNQSVTCRSNAWAPGQVTTTCQ